MNSNWAQYAWVPITLFAALAQTGRNAAQRSLVTQWRVSMTADGAGALASIAWFTCLRGKPRRSRRG